MRQIWKYILDSATLLTHDFLTYNVPKNGIILHVDEQFDEICVWVEVDPDAPKEQRHFKVYGTGHLIPDHDIVNRRYLGSVKLMKGALVFHVFEIRDL